MIGTWRWNAALGVCGAILTLLFSLESNGLAITGIRCLYAFIAFFVVAYLFRASLAIVLHPRPLAAETDRTDQPEDRTGNFVNLSTPDESRVLHDLLKGQLDEGAGTGESDRPAFTPLTPPKLVSTQNKDPEQLAKAIRHLTGG